MHTFASLSLPSFTMGYYDMIKAAILADKSRSGTSGVAIKKVRGGAERGAAGRRRTNPRQRDNLPVQRR